MFWAENDVRLFLLTRLYLEYVLRSVGGQAAQVIVENLNKTIVSKNMQNHLCNMYSPNETLSVL